MIHALIIIYHIIIISRKIPIISPGGYICTKGRFGRLISRSAHLREAGGAYYWREFCASKIVGLIFGRDFATENAAPEGIWVQSEGSELFCNITCMLSNTTKTR